MDGMSPRRSHAPGERPAPRPGGVAPSRPDRRARAAKASPEAVEPAASRALTVRTLVLGLVTLVAFIVLAPTLRAYVTQSEQQRRVDAQYAAVEADVGRLESELQRWEDPAYVQAQARERLSFVMPGEVAYRVVDPETIEPETGAAFEDMVEPVANGPEVPWYLVVWESVVVAGEPGEDAGATSPPAASVP